MFIFDVWFVKKLKSLVGVIESIDIVLIPKLPTIGPLLSVLHPVAPITTLPDLPLMAGVVPKYNVPVVCPSPITIISVSVEINKLTVSLIAVDVISVF